MHATFAESILGHAEIPDHAHVRVQIAPARLASCAVAERTPASEETRYLDHDFAPRTRAERDPPAAHEVRCRCTILLHAPSAHSWAYWTTIRASLACLVATAVEFPPLRRPLSRARKLGSKPDTRRSRAS